VKKGGHAHRDITFKTPTAAEDMISFVARLLCVCSFLASFSAIGECRVIIDMDGRSVTLADKISRIITIGPVPVLNGFLFAFGEQKAIVNGLPRELARKYQYVFAPDLQGKPIVQGAEKGLTLEEIIGLKPDIILTMDRVTVQTLEKLGLPVVFLKWTAPTDVKTLMALLGNILDKKEVADDYANYFDQALERVSQALGSVPNVERPRVLYVNFRRLTQPHRIAEWWIPRAGGRSLTDNGRAEESTTFSLEQMIAWDPEVLIVNDRGEAELILTDPRLHNMSAVRERRVYVAPAGAHLWANRTIEQPLTVLWAATIFHPEKFSQESLRNEMAAFYERFFHISLAREQIDEILAGSPGH
jgi:iron complex transport system substrate-binding protein